MTVGPLKLTTRSAQATLHVGRILGQDLVAGDLLALTGDLGSGKTCLTQGIADGFHVAQEECVRSPSFVLLNIYRGRHPMFHMDLYRMQDPEELEELGYREIFFGAGVTVVEWADRAASLLPEDCLHIRLRFLDETRREVVLESNGARFQERLAAWAEALAPFRSAAPPDPGSPEEARGTDATR